MTTSLKNPVLEIKVEEGTARISLPIIKERARDVVHQFKQYPSMTPKKIHLSECPDQRVLRMFKTDLEKELAEQGYNIPVVFSEEDGYTIRVFSYLRIKPNGKC